MNPSPIPADPDIYKIHIYLDLTFYSYISLSALNVCGAVTGARHDLFVF